MRYIGLDISMRATGFIVLDAAGAVVEQRVIGWKDRAQTLHERIGYYSRVAKAVQEAVAAHGETVVAIEGYAVHGPGDPTIAPELGGIVRLGLVRLESCLSIVEVAPAALKKYATGKGNAPKDAVMLAVYKRWAFDCGNDNNLADAYTLARMVRAGDVADDTMTASQRETLLGVFGSDCNGLRK